MFNKKRVFVRKKIELFDTRKMYISKNLVNKSESITQVNSNKID